MQLHKKSHRVSRTRKLSDEQSDFHFVRSVGRSISNSMFLISSMIRVCCYSTCYYSELIILDDLWMCDSYLLLRSPLSFFFLTLSSWDNDVSEAREQQFAQSHINKNHQMKLHRTTIKMKNKRVWFSNQIVKCVPNARQNDNLSTHLTRIDGASSLLPLRVCIVHCWLDELALGKRSTVVGFAGFPRDISPSRQTLFMRSLA